MTAPGNPRLLSAHSWRQDPERLSESLQRRPGGLRGPQERAISACPYLFRGGRDHTSSCVWFGTSWNELSEPGLINQGVPWAEAGSGSYSLLLAEPDPSPEPPNRGGHVGRQQGSEVAFRKRVRFLRAQEADLILCGISEEPSSNKRPVLRARLLCPTSYRYTEDRLVLPSDPSKTESPEPKMLRP